MMDEAEEEALFARLRSRLAASSLSGADAQLAAVAARVEAAIEARVEAAVERRTTGLRADLDHLAEHLAQPRGQGSAARPWRLAALVVASLVLAGGGAAAWFSGASLRNGVAGWRTAVLGQAE